MSPLDRQCVQHLWVQRSRWEEHLLLQSSGLQTDQEKLQKVSSFSHLLKKVPLPFPLVTLEIKGRARNKGGTPSLSQPSGAGGRKVRGSRASLTTLYIPGQVELYKILSQNNNEQTNKIDKREGASSGSTQYICRICDVLTLKELLAVYPKFNGQVFLKFCLVAMPLFIHIHGWLCLWASFTHLIYIPVRSCSRADRCIDHLADGLGWVGRWITNITQLFTSAIKGSIGSEKSRD